MTVLLLLHFPSSLSHDVVYIRNMHSNKSTMTIQNVSRT